MNPPPPLPGPPPEPPPESLGWLKRMKLGTPPLEGGGYLCHSPFRRCSLGASTSCHAFSTGPAGKSKSGGRTVGFLPFPKKNQAKNSFFWGCLKKQGRVLVLGKCFLSVSLWVFPELANIFSQSQGSQKKGEIPRESSLW